MNKPCIAAVFAFGITTSALGQTSPILVPLLTGKQLVGSNPFGACWNLHQGKCPPCPPGDASPDGGVPGPYSNPDLGPYLVPGFGDPGKSFVAPNSYNYHHYAYDYRPPELSSGCGSCGSSLAVANQGSQLSKLFIQRRHRYRDMTQTSSFGPGVFCNYDITLQFDDAGPGTLGSDAYRVEVFDPCDTTQRFMSDGCDGDTQDGYYTDRINKWVKTLICYDANGDFVTDPKLAASAVLTNWPGTTYKFDLVNLDPAEGDATGALAWWKLDDAQGQTAADATGNGNSGALVNQPSWMTGRIAGALHFDGETNYVDVGNPADLDFSGQLSIAAWVNTSATTTGPNAGSPGNQLGLIVSHGNGPCDMGSTYVPSVFLSIAGDTNVTIGCNYVDPESGYTMVDGATSPAAEADSQWVHWAGTFDGAEWRLFRNGTLVASTIAATAGATAIDDNWYIGGTGGTPNSQEGSGMFAGGIDDVQIYNRALSDNEIALLAQRKTIMGRIRSITDRNGYAVNVTYQSFSQEQIQASPDLQMQIDQVTDPYGRTASFSYLPTQVSGRWVVGQINFPNGHKAVYGYANGQLATVTFDDGTQSTFTYGADPVSQCSTVQYFDVAAEGTHRTKTAYLTNNFTIYGQDYGYNDAAMNGDIFSQSSMLVRLIANGAGEVTYLNQLLYPWYVQIYRGAGCVRELQYSWSSQYYTTFNVPTPGQFFQGPLETSYFNCSSYWSVPLSLTATYPSITDERGVVHNYQYDADSYVTNTQHGNLPAEQFSYNQFKQVTRYQDRDSNVTLYTYDGQGNLLSKQVGIKNVNGVDTHQPEYAKYQWTYYPVGDPNQFLLASAIDANGNSTEFIYDNNHRLVQVIEPPDALGDTQATTTISYDSASRVQQITDPMSRLVQYAYDARDRLATITYGDTSTERFVYGAPGSGNENLLVRQKDRNGVTTRFDYDGAGRVTTTTFAYSMMDQNDNETLITDPSVSVTKVCTYLDGTDLVASCTERGETTSYGYDYRQRLVSTTVQPRVGVALTTSRTYLNNLLFSETDPYGRTKYFGYRTSDGQLIREIQGTVPSFTLADFNAVMNQTRDATPNAKFIITDYQLDNLGQRLAIIDGNGNTLAQSFDSRGQLVQRVEASGTPIAATTGYLYDANGNTIEERSPRYYDSSDPQVGNCRTQITFTGRNLLATRTEAPGTSVAATLQYAYNLDRTRASKIDARNNTWQTLWSACCAGRKTADVDPTSASTSTEYDYAGNPTFVQILQGTTIYNQTTTQYDARRRPIFRTMWLTTAPTVDPNNPPIAGQNGLPADSGLTTQWYYDENLADDVGLSSTAGQNIANVGNVSIQQLLAELEADGIAFGGGSDGYAVLEVKPDGELRVTVMDGALRKVAYSALQPPTSQNPNQPITWLTRLDDAIATVSSPGSLLETVYLDALNNTSRRRTDGAHRTLQNVDEDANVTAMTYDANSNKLSVVDPNSVGYNAQFDARNRETARTDTMSVTAQAYFDANSNLIRCVDPKGNDSTALFDARDRYSSITDRTGGTTSWTMDAHSNIVAITDSDSNTTQFTYDARNLKLTEAYADNSPPAAVDEVVYVYDGAKRLQVRTDQAGDYVTLHYDAANRLTSREYRDSTKQPTDLPNDTDTFTFDGGNRLLTAVSGRYSNTVTFTYDQAGRLAGESLTIGGQTYAIGRTYDAAGRMLTLTYPDGSVVGQDFTPRNELQQLTFRSRLAASFTYDPGGRRTTRTLGDTSGTTTTWGYVAGGNTIASISAPGLPSFTYAYDLNNNKTAESITNVLQPYGFTTTDSGYDNADRLVTWHRQDGGDDESWTLTHTGDWSQYVNASGAQSRSHNNVHEVTAINGTNATFDEKGNVLINPLSHASLTWDFNNRLQSALVGSSLTTFTYDALGRRVSKASGSVTTVYVTATYDTCGQLSGREVAEYVLTADPTSPTNIYVFGERLDEPVLTNTTLGQFYYHLNAIGSVTHLTDSNGALRECYAYSPYGVVTFFGPDGITVLGSSAVGNSLLFAGRRFDSETASYYFRARYYDAGLGRFLTRDMPADSSCGGGVLQAPQRDNRPHEAFDSLYTCPYQYVFAQPTSLTDPLGLFPDPPMTGWVPGPGPGQYTYGRDGYWAKWQDEMRRLGRRLTYGQLDWASEQLDLGCIGVTIIHLGREPNYSNCFADLAGAQKLQGEWKREKHCPAGCTASIFSVRFWDDTNDYTPGEDGRVNLGPWLAIPPLFRGRPPGDWNDWDPHGGVNFDYGWLTRGNRWLHANQGNDPPGSMKVYSSDYDAWVRPLLDFNQKVFCVDCPNGRYGIP